MEKINGRKLSLIFIFILILLVLALLVGKFTYSYLGPTIGADLEGKGEVTASGDTLIFSKGNTLSLSATTDNFATGGSNLTATTNPKVKLIASTKTNQASATYYVGVVINSNTFAYSTINETAEVILTIKDENGNDVTSGVDGLSYVTSGGVSGFDVTGKTGLFNIKTDYPISTNSSTTGTTHTWTFTLTFVNLATDQSVNENANININIYLQKKEEFLSSITDVCSDGDNLKDCIVSLSQKSVSPLSKIYYHDNTLEYGAGDNSYRYAGPSDEVNNFVCFGSTTSPCPTDNLYRIIGVIDDKVKLIKYDYATSDLLGTDGASSDDDSVNKTYYIGYLEIINTYYWKLYNGNFYNTWSESNLNKINLNTNFVNNIGTGWANKIATTTWKVGGNTRAKISNGIPSVVYQSELMNPIPGQFSTTGETEYKAKIGLMYVSDYGFAASPSAWTTTLVNYHGNDANGTSIRTINWMYMGCWEWTITRRSDRPDMVFFASGIAGVEGVGAEEILAVRPTFNLESSITYKSGSGSQSDPIIITD